MRATEQFHSLWLAERVRLQEIQHGTLPDQVEVRLARDEADTLAGRLVCRARHLGQREHLETSLAQWANRARLVFTGLGVVALITGAGMAAATLGDGSRPVNLALALTTALGLHGLTFVVWVLAMVLPSSQAGGGLGAGWLWLSGRLGRADAVLNTQAFAGALRQSRASKPLFGVVSHSLWTLSFLAALVSLIGLLSARRYGFQWETTLLSSQAFIDLTHTLGWLPSKLGFALPSSALIRNTLDPARSESLIDAGPVWSSWLIGCIAVYGFVPRVLALVACLVVAQRRMATAQPDPDLPGFNALRSRLFPDQRQTGVDAPAPDDDLPTRGKTRRNRTQPQRSAFAGYELPRDKSWPPGGLSSMGTDLGLIDSRQQREQLHKALTDGAYTTLWLLCDANQTPDRGLLHFLAMLPADLDLRIILAGHPESDATDRRAIWHDLLRQAQLSDEAILNTDWAKLNRATPLPGEAP